MIEFKNRDDDVQNPACNWYGKYPAHHSAHISGTAAKICRTVDGRNPAPPGMYKTLKTVG